MTRKVCPKPGDGSLPNQLAVLEQRLGPIQHRPIGDLRAYKNNPRKHFGKQIVQLMSSVRQFGFTFLVVIAKEGIAPHTNNVELGRHGRYRTNVWDYPDVNTFGSNRMEDLGDHPTVKPVALVADAIRDVTKPGEIVIDGFMGSGTTILAAERTKRIAYGIDIEPRYVDVAIRRWEAMTGKQAVLADTGETIDNGSHRCR